MKKALIASNEQYTDRYSNVVLGLRIAQITDEEFEVHTNLFWVDCNDDINEHDYYYDSSDNTIKKHRDKPIELIEQSERAKRDLMLNELDDVVSNPLRWDSYTVEQKSEIATYRQALLDVPQQSGFPTSHTFPTKPEFI